MLHRSVDSNDDRSNFEMKRFLVENSIEVNGFLLPNRIRNIPSEMKYLLMFIDVIY